MELKNYYNKVRTEVHAEHIDYIKKHPEIRDILNDFMSSVLLEKPQDIFTYAKDYFTFFNTDNEKPIYQPLIICGPSGVGKVSRLFRVPSSRKSLNATPINSNCQSQPPPENLEKANKTEENTSSSMMNDSRK